MNKTYSIAFSDGSAKATGARHDGISISYLGDEQVRRLEVNGLPFISGNTAGLVKLGELLIQIGLSDYKSGFHLHIREDFDERKDEILIIGVSHENGDAT
jgi:hypothetical protein